MTPTPRAMHLAVSLCEQGSKDRSSEPLWRSEGLPVRTGVEATPPIRACHGHGPPCANRGRRHAVKGAFRLHQASLCEQGSKARCCGKAGVFTGLPVRTGVEAVPSGPCSCPIWSPCANRGRRLARCQASDSRPVSLCEQGSKGWHRADGRSGRRSPCANRGRRQGGGCRPSDLSVPLFEQGDRNRRKQRPNHLRLAPRSWEASSPRTGNRRAIAGRRSDVSVSPTRLPC